HSQHKPEKRIVSESIQIDRLLEEFIVPDDHGKSDYFSVLRKLVNGRKKYRPASTNYGQWQAAIDGVYKLLEDEIKFSQAPPLSPIKFGTSGWRGLLGKDIYAKTVSQVTLAITNLYTNNISGELQKALGVNTLAEARERGCVLGHDNRFGGEQLASCVANVLTGAGFTVYYAGESATGVLSAALLELSAAFSINLTPSHNPLEYGGFKYNAADGGPAAKIITDRITTLAGEIAAKDIIPTNPPRPELINKIDGLAIWQDFVRQGSASHRLDYDRIIDNFFDSDSLVVAIDSVHGASRVHIRELFKNRNSDRLITIRDTPDPTFNGIAPEPSPANMQLVRDQLASRKDPLKLGILIDPDADRIRFNDGIEDIEMNKFGAAVYHYLHEHKGLAGPVAKSVATSNFANAIARGLDEDVFESRVGFKEFKPIIGSALTFFEESDGISIIGHTPEKDAYIGLLLALDMTLSLNKPLSVYIKEIENDFGGFYPDRDSIEVALKGEKLLRALALLEKYTTGKTIKIGDEEKTITEIIDIDGLKMIFEDGSWLMIRPSGTEPKVRFYVESRTDEGRQDLFNTARRLLKEIGLLG
ncbi:MAG: hypothetical protein ABFQ82_03810, partial [Thermodesulfobacteriota bacterium]